MNHEETEASTQVAAATGPSRNSAMRNAQSAAADLRAFSTRGIVSVTDLSSYLYCPRALYQQRVLGKARLSRQMVLGAIRHNFYDLANRHEEKIVVHLPGESSSEEVLAAYSSTYQNLLRAAVMGYAKSLALFDVQPFDVLPELGSIALAEAKERAASVHQFSKQHNVSGERLWEALTPKIFTELKVKSLQLRLRGTVDRIEDYGSFVMPVELKTGKMARDGVWPWHRVQAAAYMMLLSERLAIPVRKAVIRYLDHNATKEVVLNSYMELEVKELTEKVARLLSGGTAPNSCGRESCGCRNS